MGYAMPVGISLQGAMCFLIAWIWRMRVPVIERLIFWGDRGWSGASSSTTKVSRHETRRSITRTVKKAKRRNAAFNRRKIKR
jgi:hypothetical protein